MAMNEIKSVTVKPDKVATMPQYADVGNEAEIKLSDGENGILLFLQSDDDCAVEILPGNSVFAGAPKRVPVYYDETACVYLESGRYVFRNPDGTASIRIRNVDPNMEISARALLLN